MKIVIVNGYPCSGKDLLCKFAYENRGKVYTYSTIDEVKKLAKIIGWDGQKDERGRKFLSDLKDAMTTYDDLPRKFILKQISKTMETYRNKEDSEVIFLVQMREPAEIKRWVELHNAKAVFVMRSNMDKKWGNHADDNVFDYPYDYYLFNNSTIEKWAETAINFIDEIRKENWESHI